MYRGMALLFAVVCLASTGCSREGPGESKDKPKKVLQTLSKKAEEMPEKKEEKAGEKKEERKKEAAYAEKKVEAADKEEWEQEKYAESKKVEKAEERKEEATAEEKKEEDEGEDRDLAGKVGGKTKGTKHSELSRDRFSARFKQIAGSDPGIQRVMRSRISAFRNCYGQLAARDRNLPGGQVKMKFTIGRAGRVTNASVEKNDTESVALEKCMLRKLKMVRFPEQEKEMEQSMVMTFDNRSRSDPLGDLEL